MRITYLSNGGSFFLPPPSSGVLRPRSLQREWYEQRRFCGLFVLLPAVHAAPSSQSHREAPYCCASACWRWQIRQMLPPPVEKREERHGGMVYLSSPLKVHKGRLQYTIHNRVPRFNSYCRSYRHSRRERHYFLFERGLLRCFGLRRAQS